MTTKNIGVVYDITITVAMRGDIANRYPLKNKGIFVSMVSMSLVNLFIILPRGVVSKNDIGACIILVRRRW